MALANLSTTESESSNANWNSAYNSLAKKLGLEALDGNVLTLATEHFSIKPSQQNVDTHTYMLLTKLLLTETILSKVHTCDVSYNGRDNEGSYTNIIGNTYISMRKCFLAIVSTQDHIARRLEDFCGDAVGRAYDDQIPNGDLLHAPKGEEYYRKLGRHLDVSGIVGNTINGLFADDKEGKLQTILPPENRDILEICLRLDTMYRAMDSRPGAGLHADEIKDVGSLAVDVTTTTSLVKHQERWYEMLDGLAEKLGFPKSSVVKIALQETIRSIPAIDLGEGR